MMGPLCIFAYTRVPSEAYATQRVLRGFGLTRTQIAADMAPG